MYVLIMVHLNVYIVFRFIQGFQISMHLQRMAITRLYIKLNRNRSYESTVRHRSYALPVM
jgi:hypothetical protein